MPVLWGDERKHRHCLYSREEAPRDHIPLWGMLHQAVQGATAPISTYEDLPPLSHEPAGGFSAECEEEVVKLPPPPLAHENPEVLLVQRPQACVCDRDLWSPVF